MYDHLKFQLSYVDTPFLPERIQITRLYPQ